MTQLENIPLQEEKVSITLSIPASELSGLVPINYKTLAKEVLKEIDMDDLASDVKDNFDMSDLASDVKDNFDMSDLASDVKDCINMKDLASDVKDNLDMDDFANDIARNIRDDAESVEERISELMDGYDARSDCQTSKKATKVIISAIRYDIMTHLDSKSSYDLDSTMTGTLRRFIQKIIDNNNEQIAQKYETLTFGQVVDVLDSIQGLDFNIKLEIRSALTNVLYTKKQSPADVIVKAD